jgi:hypothetical protein
MSTAAKDGSKAVVTQDIDEEDIFDLSKISMVQHPVTKNTSLHELDSNTGGASIIPTTRQDPVATTLAAKDDNKAAAIKDIEDEDVFDFSKILMAKDNPKAAVVTNAVEEEDVFDLSQVLQAAFPAGFGECSSIPWVCDFLADEEFIRCSYREPYRQCDYYQELLFW